MTLKPPSVSLPPPLLFSSSATPKLATQHRLPEWHPALVVRIPCGERLNPGAMVSPLLAVPVRSLVDLYFPELMAAFSWRRKLLSDAGRASTLPAARAELAWRRKIASREVQWKRPGREEDPDELVIEVFAPTSCKAKGKPLGLTYKEGHFDQRDLKDRLKLPDEEGSNLNILRE